MTAAARALDQAVADLGGTPRTGQQRMAEEVGAALTGGRVALVQAGTGTGKSLGYLVPALAALAAGDVKRVVVSTATLALQRQIVTKDAPLAAGAVSAVTGTTLNVALLKGWHHYVCRHKIEGGYPDDGMALFDVEDAEPTAGSVGEDIVRVRAWAEDSDTGDRDDLPGGVADKVWRHVSVTRQECLGARCPLFDACFAVAARNRAAEADLVVTNHTMLGIHASSDAPILPEFDALIVDEAHDLAARVTAAGALQVSGGIVARLLRIVNRSAPSTDLGSAADALGDALEETASGRITGLPETLHDAATMLDAACRDAASDLRKESGEDDGGRAQAKAAIVDLWSVAQRLLDHAPDGGDVVWVERGRDGTEAPLLKIAPLDVAPLIADKLLTDRGVVLTSATLALGGTFDAAAAAVGAHLLGKGAWHGVDVGSPFEYAKQGILYVAADVPLPGRDGVSEEALDALAELVEAAGGRTLGLFSSRRGAERAAERLRVTIDTPVLVQGENQLGQLVDEFLADEHATLLGTLSLWQGVDAPGDTCRLVVMDRIPFPRPDDPMIEARNELVKKRRGNPFMAVSATHAALLLAQGAGRLIRRSTDRGVVAILDPRLETARYGSFLRASLPGFWPTTSKDVAISALERLGG